MKRLLSRIPGSQVLVSLGAHELAGCPLSLLASLALAQIVQGVVKAGFKDLAHPARNEPTAPVLAAIELAKCVVALGLLYSNVGARLWGKIGGAARYVSLPEENLPLYSATEEGLETRDPQDTEDAPRDRPASTWSTRELYMVLVPIASLYLLWHQLIVLRHPYADKTPLAVVDASIILFIGLYTYILAGRTTPLRHWTSASLQIAAFCLIHRVIKLPEYSASTYSLMLLSSALPAFLLIAISLIYQTLHDVSLHRLNLVLFSSCLAGYSFAMLLPSPSNERSVPFGATTADLIASAVFLFYRIVEDFLVLAVLRRSSAFTVAAVTLFSSSVVLPLSHGVFWTTIPFSNVQGLASLLAIYALLSYLLDTPDEPTPPRDTASLWPTRRNLVLLGLTFLPLLTIPVFNPPTPIPPHKSSFVWNKATADMPRLMPHQYDNHTQISTGHDACVRRPLPVSSAYVGPGERPNFHAFDDVLLVVFFSHDRYDLNLDGYREVYSQYFPNMLFIGPGSREDRGFLYSYDVVLDSYMAHEDFNAGWFKMGGRMAHHMLYTAVKDYPCYAGYLWAPFDALLNVPRFMQFPQDRIWYHSPFTERYIPNPAQPEGVTKAKRPPPARISENTPREYALEANTWGAGWVWWWGEKHMGLEECMPAYERLPENMRQRLERLIGAPGHLIGGSADTLYLPGHLRADFLDVVGTFLQTDCFLEIVLPTALHMILPLNEEIIWVDHWWKHPPPWNTTYVRDLWEEGYEVDSFHSFHWGDIQDDGFFRPNRNSVKDMQALLADSFQRQGISTPTLTHSDS
ncbi:hypothetical protein C8R43DRAFT_673819 [Mycena crocata]|nr:hypothetical protein C8R43DRAFT_673819 [Mycena crocata]